MKITTDALRRFPPLRRPELGLLTLTVLILFYRPLFGGETFFYRDISVQFYPQRLRLARWLQAGELPWWDPLIQGGQPYWSNVVNLPAYPTIGFYWVFSPITAFNVELVVHVLWAALGAYWLGRCLGFSRTASLLSAYVYAFTGPLLSLMNLMSIFISMTYWPWVLGAWHRWFLERRRRWLVASVTLGALQVLGGSPEVMAMTTAFLLGWALLAPSQFSGSPRREGVRPILRVWQGAVHWGLWVIGVLGVTAFQVLPALYQFLSSRRPQGIPYVVVTTWPIHPKRLPELVLPEFMGRIDKQFQRDFWGQALDPTLPYLTSIYVGAPTLLLALAGLWARRPDPWPWPLKGWLVTTALVGVGFSLGPHLPGVAELYRYPPWNWFRFPSKYFLLTCLPLTLLAARGLEWLMADDHEPFPRRSHRTFLTVSWIFGAAWVTVWALWRFVPAWAERWARWTFHRWDPMMDQGLQRSLTHTLIVTLTTLLLFSYRWYRPRPWQKRLLVAIVAADLFAAAQHVNVYAPRNLYQVPDLAILVRNHIGLGRLVRIEAPPGTIPLEQLPEPSVLYRRILDMESLDFWLGTLYDIPMIFHRDVGGVQNRWVSDLVREFLNTPWSQCRPILTAAGVTVLIAPQGMGPPDLQVLGRVRAYTDYYVYKHEEALPPVYFVSSSRSFQDPQTLLQTLFSSSWDPRREVLLLGSRQLTSSPCAHRLEYRRASNHRMDVTVTTDCPGYVVFSETWDPGWKVLVDRRPVPLLRANHAFMAVEVSAGTHHVEWSYTPAGLPVGLGLSLLTLILGGVRWARYRRLDTRRTLRGRPM